MAPGGTGDSYSDLHILHVDSMTWSTPVLSSTLQPGARAYHSAHVVTPPGSGNGTLVIVGGMHGETVFDDIWAVDVDLLCADHPTTATRPSGTLGGEEEGDGAGRRDVANLHERLREAVDNERARSEALLARALEAEASLARLRATVVSEEGAVKRYEALERTAHIDGRQDGAAVPTPEAVHEDTGARTSLWWAGGRRGKLNEDSRPMRAAARPGLVAVDRALEHADLLQERLVALEAQLLAK